MARKRPFIIAAAATAAISVPPAANTASAANWAEPANTNADAAIAWPGEKPAWRATTPNDRDSTKPTTA